jgi:putative ABC transport system substrate-binding protein
MAATRTIPIVFTTGTDPVAAGLVASLNRPGGNATGVTFLGNELLPKRMELLHEVIPGATKVALLVNSKNPAASQGIIPDAQEAARRLGLEIVVLNASTEDEVRAAFSSAVQHRAAAIFVTAEAYLTSLRSQIAALGVRHRLPTVTADRGAVAAGMLISYGASIPDTYRQAGIYVGRILKGDKPSDLPVMQPTKFELVVNLKTAKAIGLTIPETFLVRADEVIE